MFFQANNLKKYGDVELLFSHVSDKDKGRITRELELNPIIPIKQFGRIKNEIIQLALSFLFPSRIKKIKTDLIISHSFMATRMAYEKKKRDGTPYAVILYHPPNFLYSSIEGWANTSARLFAKFLGIFFKEKLKKLDIECVRKADLIIAISDYTAKRVREIYKINPAIIYPQISDFFRLMEKSEKQKFLKNKKIKKKFFYVHGRIIPDKNYAILLDIIKNIKGFDLIISGSIEDYYKKELNLKISELHLKHRVKILGKIPKEDLLGYYNCAELFLMPAKKEDFGLTTVEAIACGCPVIAWDDNAGPSEIITKDNGLLVKPYNLSDFSSKIQVALNKKLDRKEISKTVDKFSEENVGKNLIKVLKPYLN